MSGRICDWLSVEKKKKKTNDNYAHNDDGRETVHVNIYVPRTRIYIYTCTNRTVESGGSASTKLLFVASYDKIE